MASKTAVRSSRRQSNHAAPVAAAVRRPDRWTSEYSDQGVDAETGVIVHRLTSAAHPSHNIYCETPYSTADGRYIFFQRAADYSFSPTRSLLAADLHTGLVRMLEPEVLPIFAHSAWSDRFAFFDLQGILTQLNFVTGERRAFPAVRLQEKRHLCTFMPDFTQAFLHDNTDTANPAIVRIDTATGHETRLCGGPEFTNPHLWVDHVHADRLLLQLLPGAVVSPLGQWLKKADDVVVATMDLDGGNLKVLPSGGAFTAPSTGHHCWISGTRRIVYAANWNRQTGAHDPKHPQGNLFVTGPDLAAPQLIPAPEHRFYHVSCSRDGKYWVCDDFAAFTAPNQRPGPEHPAGIVAGSFATGKYRRVLRDVRAYGLYGTSESEPDPYFTGDNARVIFNGSPFGINQVFSATLPSGFLTSLD